MANIIFKRGLQANLPNVVEDGVFYLTTDTNRLYVGQPVGNSVERKLLNQSVQIVGTMNELITAANGWINAGTADDHINDFYYVVDANVLAVYTGTDKTTNSGWTQINPDTNTTTKSIGVAATSSTTNDVKVEVTHTDSNNAEKKGDIHFIGDGTAHVSVDNGKVKITGDSYSLSAPVISADSKTATVTLTNSDGIAAHNSTLVLESGDLNTLELSKSNDNKIILTSKNTNLSGTAAVTVGANAGTVTVTVKDSDGNQKTGTANTVGVVLNDGSYAPLTTAASGASTGALYSKTEIDNKLAGLDGMTYKGTFGTGSSGATISTLPTTNVKNGDTYVIITEDLTSANFTGVTFEGADIDKGTRVGDMLIAKGTETNDVITSNLVWTYIPAGNDTLAEVTYSASVDETTHSMGLVNGNTATIAKLNLVAGTDMALSSTKTSVNGRTDNTLTTTINHAPITTSGPTAASTLSDGSATFTAIKSLTISNGHVTGITTDTFTPVTYDLEGATSQTVSTNNVNVKIRLKNSNSAYSAHDAIFNLNSSSLAITPDANDSKKIAINLEWGNF